MGSLQDPVAWYKIAHAGEQVVQWDFQNNATRTSPPRPTFVLEVPLRNLLTSMSDFVPRDRIVKKTKIVWRADKIMAQYIATTTFFCTAL